MFSTHLNDNMGITGDHLTWRDDAHMLPFDGVADWKGIADRMNAVGYKDALTFELTRFNRPERHTSDAYEKMSFEEYATLALEKAREFAKYIKD
jgi:sugar phosphate isomerase/epimerase